MRLKTAGISVIAIALLTGLSSCTPATPVTEDVIGKTLLDARPLLPDTLLIYDLSTPILELDPVYNDGQPQGNWVIIAQCPEIDNRVLGVIPIDDYKGDIKATAEEHGWDNALLECGE